VFITFHCREDGWRESRGLKTYQVKKDIEREGENKKSHKQKRNLERRLNFGHLKIPMANAANNFQCQEKVHEPGREKCYCSDEAIISDKCNATGS
jgi:hypothetical protein